VDRGAVQHFWTRYASAASGRRGLAANR
jgi:hypothetical protein